MSAVALISDLMAASQAASAANRAGAELTIVVSPESLLAAIERIRPKLVVVDLSHPGLDVPALAAQLAPLVGNECVTLAFGPHVHKNRLDAARDAGFAQVITRGQFHANLDPIFRALGGGAR